MPKGDRLEKKPYQLMVLDYRPVRIIDLMFEEWERFKGKQFMFLQHQENMNLIKLMGCS